MESKGMLVVVSAAVAFIFLSGCLEPPVCGNDICELVEDAINCPNDCRETPLETCGNSIIDPSETCGNCPEDVICGRGKLCCNETCTTPVCTSSRNCNDGNPATEDKCLNPSTCAARCDNPPIAAGVTCESSDPTKIILKSYEISSSRQSIRLMNAVGYGILIDETIATRGRGFAASGNVLSPGNSYVTGSGGVIEIVPECEDGSCSPGLVFENAQLLLSYTNNYTGTRGNFTITCNGRIAN